MYPMVATALTRPAANFGSSAAALMPVGNPSAHPSPHSTVPAIAVASDGPKMTINTPTSDIAAPARRVSTRPWRSSVCGPNHRPMVMAATNST